MLLSPLPRHCLPTSSAAGVKCSPAAFHHSLWLSVLQDSDTSGLEVEPCVGGIIGSGSSHGGSGPPRVTRCLWKYCFSCKFYFGIFFMSFFQSAGDGEDKSVTFSESTAVQRLLLIYQQLLEHQIYDFWALESASRRSGSFGRKNTLKESLVQWVKYTLIGSRGNESRQGCSCSVNAFMSLIFSSSCAGAL